MNIPADHTPVTLPFGVSLDAVMDLGAVLGRQAAASLLADTMEGLTMGQQRRAEALTFEGVEELEAAVAAIEREAVGAGDFIAGALHQAMVQYVNPSTALRG
ncbi:hypothetical protein [Acidisphaera sp. L21]|uniref:hypothetical protein n=1 Tax=Acidisphaera sp. L21 TaxID=1641851 RepID=UPI00131D9788|nr:hypothetical protein [Acidisphaera sp. L21]